MKKFYKEAKAVRTIQGWTIQLDHSPVFTPMKNIFILPSQKMSELIANEWNSQKIEFEPADMHITQLANTMIDKISDELMREVMEEEVVKYASSDLVCYFTDKPVDLAERQRDLWLPLIDWLKTVYKIEFLIADGVQYIDQAGGSLNKIREIIRKMDSVSFTSLQYVASLTGSFIIAFALVKNRITLEEAYKAAFVDDLYQLEKWGSDEEAEDRLSHIKADMASAYAFNQTAQ